MIHQYSGAVTTVLTVASNLISVALCFLFAQYSVLHVKDIGHLDNITKGKG